MSDGSTKRPNAFSILVAEVEQTIRDLRSLFAKAEKSREWERDQFRQGVDGWQKRIAEAEKEAALHNKAKLGLTDAYNKLHEKFTDVEKRAQAAESVVETWRKARGFGDLRENSEGWNSVKQMDAAILKYDTEKE